MLTSVDGAKYEPATELGCPPLGEIGDWRAGFAIALFEPRFARYLRIELSGHTGEKLGVDEVVVFPSAHLLWGVPAVVEGDIGSGSVRTGATALSDGRLGGDLHRADRCRRGRGRHGPPRRVVAADPAAHGADPHDRLRPQGCAWHRVGGTSRRHIIAQCERSLRRLRTDWIDLCQIHLPFPEIPLDETRRALDDLVRAGKVRYLGGSNCAAWPCWK